MKLYHYYEASAGAFRNLSDLSPEEAKRVMDGLKTRGGMFASKRPDGYLERRRELETLARDIFVRKGGRTVRTAPHYMVLERCDWLESWYENPRFVGMDAGMFDTGTLSFCYGDLFPTFSPHIMDGREYRRQVYTYDEILTLIDKYGLPQNWNAYGSLGPERYIEVHVWDDAPILKFIKQ